VFRQDNVQYEWSGEYETLSPSEDSTITIDHPFIDDDEDSLPKANLAFERLLRNGKLIISRNGNDIQLLGVTTPKLASNESVIHLLRNEEAVAVAYRGLDSILFVDHTEEHHNRRILSFGRNFESLKKKYKTIDAIRSKDMPTHLKLALAFENCPEVFQEISRQFQDAFPYVEELEFKFVEAGPFGLIPRLYMKEEGVDAPIPEDSISSGMHRTLMHLSRMALWPDGTVVLIDEFENSFGVNCIDFVTHDLKIQSSRMQFILTSHHPYIINNISMSKWKIVSRKGDMVIVGGPEPLQKNASHHEAFLQLLNLPHYVEGISTE
jgi:predicted ATPase